MALDGQVGVSSPQIEISGYKMQAYLTVLEEKLVKSPKSSNAKRWFDKFSKSRVIEL